MDFITLVWQGMIIGLAMLIPGVSGGTMAVIMGIFDRLVFAIGNIFKSFRKSLLLLAPLAVGIGLGMLVFAKPIVFMLDHLFAPTMFLFMGGVIGGFPSLIREAGVEKKSINPKNITLFLLGVAVVLLIEFLPKNLFTITPQDGWSNFLVLFFSGLISSIAFVLPGISGSYMLLLLGMYDTMMRAVSDLDIVRLIPLGIGIGLGLLLIGKLLQVLLKHHYQATYMVILGFVFVSVFLLFPGVPTGIDWLLCPLFFVLGFGAIFLLSRWERKKTKEKAQS